MRKPKEEPEKPAAKKASFFKKSKKKKKPKASEKPNKAPKAEEKQKKEKKKGSGFFQKFVSELKEAAEDIKPKALVSSASEGLGSLKSMVGGKEEDAEATPKSGRPKEAAASSEGDESATAAQAEAESEPAQAEASAPPSAEAPPAQDEAAPAPASGAPSAAPPASGGDAPPTFSATKVQKVTPKKKRTRKPPKPKKDLTEELEEAVAAAPEDEPVSATPEIGEEETQDSIQPEPEEIQADREEVEAPTEKEEPEPLEADEPEVVSASAEEAEAVGVADEPKQEPASSQKSEEASGGKKKAKKLPQKQVQQVSKSEQLMRSFQALQILLNDETWSPVVTDPESRPSTLFSPRAGFDKNFASVEFRKGLKAASQLASTYCFDLESISFDPSAIEQVKELELDPGKIIKRDEDLLTKLLNKDTVKTALGMLQEEDVRKLLYSVGTRLGTFIPTIEILARIYLGLKKKNDIIPGKRLAIQEEVLLKYKNAPYSDAKGKKARNLALNYYMDYLAAHAMKLYKDRFESAPEGQQNVEAHYRRHGVIKDYCFKVIDDAGTRLGLPSYGVTHLKDRVAEMADIFIKDTVGENPNSEDQEDT